MRLPIGVRNSSGMLPLSSIVRYEMQRFASSRYGPRMAWVGQISMQRLQLPQCALAGGSIGSGRSVYSSPRKKYEPARQGFFQHGRGVHVSAIAEVADHRMDALGQFLQTVAHQLVIVAPQRVARHVTGLGIF
jgi:hypothetical protein